MIRLASLLILVIIASSLSTSRVHAATPVEQTVTATVTGQSVSMTVSPTSIDYGTVPFETSRTSLAAPDGAVTFEATNTGNVPEDFLVRAPPQRAQASRGHSKQAPSPANLLRTATSFGTA